MNSIKLTTLLLLMNTLTGLSQKVTVIDKVSKTPIPYVKFIDIETQKWIETDEKGTVNLAALQWGKEISTHAFGYQSERIIPSTLTNKNTIIELTNLICHLNEIVVSANRTSQRRYEVPQQIEIIGNNEIQFVNPQTTSDLVKNSGLAFVQMSQMGGGSVVLRGFEANKIALVVDGVKLNNAIYRGGHLQNILTIDNSMLEKMEILYGAGSVIYGSDALGGVIHFYTKKNCFADSLIVTTVKTNAFARYASANREQTTHGDFNLGFKKISFLTSFTFSNFDDLRMGSERDDNYANWGKRLYYIQTINGKDSVMSNKHQNIQTPTAYKQYDLIEKIALKQTERIIHLLNIQYSSSSNIPRYDKLTEVNKNGEFKSAEWYYGPQKRLLTSYNLNNTSPSLLFEEINTTLAYQNIEESRHNRNFNSSILNHRTEKLNILSLISDFSKKINSNQLHYGIELNYNNVNSNAYQQNIYTNSNMPLDTRYPDGGSEMTTSALYLSHRWRINEKITLNNGARYSISTLNATFVDTSFFSFPFKEISQKTHSITGNIGFVVTPSNNMRITLLGSTGYRAPNIDDLSKVFESTAGTIIIPNPNLKPEYTYNGEFGLFKSINNLINLELDCYYTSYNNIITTQKSSYNGNDSIYYNGELSQVTTQANVNKGFIYGANGMAKIFFTKSVSLKTSLTYTYGRLKTYSVNYPLDHIPPLFGKTSLFIIINKFKGEVSLLYNGWKRIKDYNLLGEDNQQYATPDGTPSWCIATIKSSIPLNQHITLQLGIENIFDKHYRAFASGISGAGRNFVCTLRGSF